MIVGIITDKLYIYIYIGISNVDIHTEVAGYYPAWSDTGQP